MHFIALKRQTFLSFLEYRVLTSSFLGFRAQATRVSYKPVSYKKHRVFVHPEALHDMIIKKYFCNLLYFFFTRKLQLMFFSVSLFFYFFPASKHGVIRWMFRASRVLNSKNKSGHDTC